jgi:cupin 2 domain-containing protein
MTALNVYQDLPDAQLAEVIETIISGGGTTVERIVTLGQVTPLGEWLESPRSEWVLLLQGKARLSFSGGSTMLLKPGDHVNIPARTRHRVEWSDPEQVVVWLAIHYSQEKTGGGGA